MAVAAHVSPDDLMATCWPRPACSPALGVGFRP